MCILVMLLYAVLQLFKFINIKNRKNGNEENKNVSFKQKYIKKSDCADENGYTSDWRIFSVLMASSVDLYKLLYRHL